VRSALFMAVVLALWSPHVVAQSAGRALGEPTDVKACMNCHEEPHVIGVFATAHMVKGDPRTEVATQGCQNCHGSSEVHMERPADGGLRAPPDVIFTGLRVSPVEKRNQTCIGCHEAGARVHWRGSQHETSDLACTDCHVSHDVDDKVRIKSTQAEVCFGCHAEQRAANLKPSHHPVMEGIMGCSDCHDPHGSVGPFMLAGETVNETCLNCHDEKRGPFLWEHAPVQEDCTICHTPHGSVQVALLKQRPPYLCQSCHDSTLHNSQPFSGASIPGGQSPSRMMVLRGCLNCHSEVHGSNHPSGIRFGR
jgi:DmsE family decaheme c-type cytochrome